MKKFLVVLAFLLNATVAFAQTSPNLIKGQVLTAAQWNQLFINKQDTLGYIPLNTAGGVMTGKLVTTAPGVATAGFNLTPGTTPSTPINGDLWTTSGGLFIRVNGSTVNLIGASAASFAATSPITISFPANVVTYACATCGVTGSPLSQFASTTSAQLAGIISNKTGTGVLVFNDTPTLITPVLGVATGTSLALGGCGIGSNALCVSGTAVFGNPVTFSGALTYGGVTLANAVTGTTNMVLSASPTLTGTITAAAANFSGDVQVISSTATAFRVGQLNGSNTAFQVDTSTGSLGTGVSIKGAAVGGGVAIAAISSGTNESLSINAKGNQTLNLQNVGTGSIVHNTATSFLAAITYGGVTWSNSVTGTGSPMLNTTPNIVTGFTIGGAATSGNYIRGNGTNFVSSAILVADLPVVANTSGSPSTTFGIMKCDGVTTVCASGVVTASGGSATSITVGTTTIVSGTTGRIIYDNAGVIGEATIGAGLQLTGGVLLANNSMGANKYQVFGVGSGTITTPTGAAWARFRLVGSGGGGGGSGSAGAGSGVAGSAVCIKSTGSACVTPEYSAGGGTGGTWGAAGGAGGVVTGSLTCTDTMVGGDGASEAFGSGTAASGVPGAPGGNSSRGGGGAAGAVNTAGNAGGQFTGGGGQGGGTTTGGFVGSGGGAGATCIIFIQSPAASYTYTVGIAGTGGAAGTSGTAGGAGGVGRITAEYGFN